MRISDWSSDVCSSDLHAFRLEKNVGGPFALVDHHGPAVTEQDFRGRFMLVYFGYTSCPDVCPTELATMAAALDSLATAAAAVQPPCIPADPARNTAGLLAGPVAHFPPPPAATPPPT